jgi:hypothetical protein
MESDAEWISVVDSIGDGAGQSQLYIEQNDEDGTRKGTVRLIANGGETQSVAITQEPMENNGWSDVVDLPNNFGIGWGYDAKTDVADISGLRGQIFNAQSMKSSYGNQQIATVENYSATSTTLISEESAEAMSQKVSVNIYGKVDLKVASAKIQAEFAKQIKENKSRVYVWYRDYRQVKLCNLTADICSKTSAPSSFTYSFKKSITDLANSKITAAEFVRRYGTHVVKRSSLGGKLDYYFTFSKDVKETVETVTLTVTVKVLGIKKSASTVKEKTWSDIKEDFIGNFRVSGGGKKGVELTNLFDTYCNKGIAMPDSKSGVIEEWQAVFSDVNGVQPEDLTLVDFYVVPIWDVVETKSAKAAEKLENYIKYEYLK